METEQWRQIPGHSDYEVSWLGRVKSYKRNPDGQVMKTGLNGEGYPQVRLDNQIYCVHNLVMETFIGQRQKGEVIRHWDDVKTNNCLLNLFYGSVQDNADDRVRNSFPQI